MQSSISISGGKANVSIRCTVNKKAQLAILFFEFDTKESELLNGLLHKYKHEKFVNCGFNPNNFIHNCILGNCCIMIEVPENKIAQNIILLYSYLAKSEVRGKYKKTIPSGNYSSMMSDISSFKVIVTGKCKRFIQQMKDDKKRDRIANGLKAVTPKSRESFKNDKVDDDNECADCVAVMDSDKDTAMFYLAVVLGGIACELKKKGGKTEVHFNDCADCCAFHELMLLKEKVVFQTHIRSVLTQAGNVGVPSANDKGGEKFKEKCKDILNAENALAYIISHLRGFSFSFDKVDELKKVDQKALGDVLKLTIPKPKKQ